MKMTATSNSVETTSSNVQVVTTSILRTWAYISNNRKNLEKTTIVPDVRTIANGEESKSAEIKTFKFLHIFYVVVTTHTNLLTTTRIGSEENSKRVCPVTFLLELSHRKRKMKPYTVSVIGLDKS